MMVVVGENGKQETQGKMVAIDNAWFVATVQ